MKKLSVLIGLFIFTLSAGAIVPEGEKDLSENEPVISIDEARKKMEDYTKGLSPFSSIYICEGKEYYIGEVRLKGYENINTITKIYIHKKTGDVYLVPFEVSNYCYMVENR